MLSLNSARQLQPNRGKRKSLALPSNYINRVQSVSTTQPASTPNVVARANERKPREFFRVNLSRRQRQAELMDDPALDVDRHRQALDGLRRVNQISRTARVLWPILAKTPTGEAPLRILDLASGGGDLAVSLARQAEMAGRPCVIEGWDISPTAVTMAQTAALAAGLNDVTFRVKDALRHAIPQNFDAVLCTLFLHHLSNQGVVRLLRKMCDATNHLVLADDLRRTRLGYWAAWVGCRLLSRSPIVHVDGPRSVQGAFTEGEVQELARAAGLEGAIVRRHWPQRFLLTWRKP